MEEKTRYSNLTRNLRSFSDHQEQGLSAHEWRHEILRN